MYRRGWGTVRAIGVLSVRSVYMRGVCVWVCGAEGGLGCVCVSGGVGVV